MLVVLQNISTYNGEEASNDITAVNAFVKFIDDFNGHPMIIVEAEKDIHSSNRYHKRSSALDEQYKNIPETVGKRFKELQEFDSHTMWIHVE